jgi:hypothetical protein
LVTLLSVINDVVTAFREYACGATGVRIYITVERAIITLFTVILNTIPTRGVTTACSAGVGEGIAVIVSSIIALLTKLRVYDTITTGINRAVSETSSPIDRAEVTVLE